MREILFRGITENTNDWSYGSYVYSPSDKQSYICENEDEELYFPVDEETVGQFTGLTDKNGKKIFEGDIVKRELAYITINASVSWNEKYLQYELNCISGKYKGNHWWLSSDSQDYELLGNCFDNPELLNDLK